jgi:hypothetical protein
MRRCAVERQPGSGRNDDPRGGGNHCGYSGDKVYANGRAAEIGYCGHGAATANDRYPDTVAACCQS